MTSPRLTRRSLFTSAGLAASALGLSACGLDGSTAFGSGGISGPILVGSADFTESQIIAELYAAALRVRGLDATTSPAIGAREAYLGALREGTVSVVPDYSGNLLLYFDAGTTAVTAEEIVQALPAALPDELGVLNASQAENKDSLVVTAATAEEYNLTSLDNLTALSSQLSLGAPPEFAERAYGLPGLERLYSFTPASFEPINDGGGPLTVSALADGTVDIVDLFSTDPAITANNFVVLEDPKNMILAQQVLPVINTRQVSVAAARVLDEVSALLTTETLIEFNTRVSGSEKAAPATAAGDWVNENFA